MSLFSSRKVYELGHESKVDFIWQRRGRKEKVAKEYSLKY